MIGETLSNNYSKINNHIQLDTTIKGIKFISLLWLKVRSHIVKPMRVWEG